MHLTLILLMAATISIRLLGRGTSRLPTYCQREVWNQWRWHTTRSVSQSAVSQASDRSMRGIEQTKKKKTHLPAMDGQVRSLEKLSATTKLTVLHYSLQELNTLNSDVGFEQRWFFFRPMKLVAKKSHCHSKRMSRSENSLKENSITLPLFILINLLV